MPAGAFDPKAQVAFPGQGSWGFCHRPREPSVARHVEVAGPWRVGSALPPVDAHSTTTPRMRARSRAHEAHACPSLCRTLATDPFDQNGFVEMRTKSRAYVAARKRERKAAAEVDAHTSSQPEARLADAWWLAARTNEVIHASLLRIRVACAAPKMPYAEQATVRSEARVHICASCTTFSGYACTYPARRRRRSWHVRLHRVDFQSGRMCGNLTRSQLALPRARARWFARRFQAARRRCNYTPPVQLR